MCVCHEFGSCLGTVAIPLLVAHYTSPQYFDMMQILLRWYVYVTKYMLIDVTEHAILKLLLLRYTTERKLDTLNTILLLVDHILLLCSFVSFFLLSVVSV